MSIEAGVNSVDAASATRGRVQAVGETNEARQATTGLSVRLRQMHERAVPPREQRQVRRLRIERQESVNGELGRADRPRELAPELARAPVADVEQRARFAEAALAELVHEAARPPDVRHLDERQPARLQHPTELPEGSDSRRPREVLEHAVREDDVGGPVREGKVPRVADEIFGLDLELLRDTPRRADRVERRVDADDAVAAPRRADAPPAPVAADLEKRPAFARRQPNLGDGVRRQVSNQVAVEVAARGGDHVLHKGVGVAAGLPPFERDPARAVRRLVLLDEQKRNGVEERIAVPGRTLQLVAYVDERAPVPG